MNNKFSRSWGEGALKRCKRMPQLAGAICLIGLAGLAPAECIVGENGIEGSDLYHIKISKPDYTDVIESDCVTPGSITLGADAQIPDGVIVDLISPSVSIGTEVGVALGGELHVLSLRRPLNDTGIVTCADNTNTNLDCPVTDFPGQDAEYGRDATYADNDEDGLAGFSFTKLDASGKALATDAADWSCVKDNVTGLIWEKKTKEAGHHDWKSEYSWYDPIKAPDPDNPGDEDGGDCDRTFSKCDTTHFVEAVNAEGYCGANDWRMPSIVELRSLVDRGHPEFDVMIDLKFFPNTVDSIYWSGLPNVNPGVTTYVKELDFGEGDEGHDTTSRDWFVRLVRGWK